MVHSTTNGVFVIGNREMRVHPACPQLLLLQLLPPCGTCSQKRNEAILEAVPRSESDDVCLIPVSLHFHTRLDSGRRGYTCATYALSSNGNELVGGQVVGKRVASVEHTLPRPTTFSSSDTAQQDLAL